MISQDITSDDDIIDPRDVTARIEELEELKAEAKANKDEDFDECEQEELDMLNELAVDMGDETLINESYFGDYARQMADDCCEGNFDSWPNSCIDWAQAANELKMDYTTVEFNGTTFYTRG